MSEFQSYDLDAERMILGSMLQDNEAYDKAIRSLRAEDFYLVPHQQLFKAILGHNYYKNGEKYLLNFIELFSQEMDIEIIGGEEYIESLKVLCKADPAMLSECCISVKEKAVTRKINQIYSFATNTVDRVVELINHYHSKPLSASIVNEVKSLPQVKDVLRKTFNTLKTRNSLRLDITGVPSGFRELDKLTMGFQPGDLIVVTGNPHVGKTAFALNCAQYVADPEHGEQSVLFCSLDKSKEEAAFRLLSASGQVSLEKMRTGTVEDLDWVKMTHSAGILHELPITIDDTTKLTVGMLFAKALHLKSEAGLGMIIVDSLQMLHSCNQGLNLTDIVPSLKDLATEIQIPVVVTVQLDSLSSEAATHCQKPTMRDLRDIGDIELTADVILIIHRGDLYEERVADKKGIAEVIVAKQRNGPTGTIQLAFNHQCACFENMHVTSGC